MRVFILKDLMSELDRSFLELNIYKIKNSKLFLEVRKRLGI